MSELSPGFVFPYALTVAAAHDYLSRGDSEADFATFYTEHNLSDFDVLQRLYRASVMRAMTAGQESSEKSIPGHDEVNNILDVILTPGIDEANLAYRYGRGFLLRSGVTDPEIVPIVQRSVSLARLLGATRSAGITQAFNDRLASGEFDPEILTLTDDTGHLRHLDISETGKGLLKASSESVCPMLGEMASVSGTQEVVRLYDLYWGALVMQAHIDLEMSGELEMPPSTESP